MMGNVLKSKTKTFHPGDIFTGISEKAFSQSSTKEGENYQERLQQRIPCPECGMELTAGSIKEHHIRLHGTEPEIDWDRLQVSQTEKIRIVYEVSFPNNMKLCQCPFPRCPGTSHSRSGICNHFRRIH